MHYVHSILHTITIHNNVTNNQPITLEIGAKRLFFKIGARRGEILRTIL